MTTALQRTRRLGERWYFALNGKPVSGDVVCIERQTKVQSSPVKQIHVYRRNNGGKTYRIPPAKLFTQATGISSKPKKIAHVKLATSDFGDL